MDKELKEDWLEALRSGEHYQIKGQLENPDGGQCCLAVLCEVAGLNSVADGNYVMYGVRSYEDAEAFNLDEVDDHGCSDADLPEPFATQVGIPYYVQTQLQAMNDLDGCTFEQIADWIEVNL